MVLGLRKVTSATSTILFRRPVERVKTICVFGTARGGTSMTAGLVRKLGVQMGDRLDPASSDDLEFAAHRGARDMFLDVSLAVEKKRYLAHLKQVIAARNAANEVWGWKDPIAGCYLDAICDDLRNPCFIVVMRDLVTVAQRARLEGVNPEPESLLDFMDDAIGDYRAMIGLLKRRRCPTLLVSYERALRAPRDLAAMLVEFLGLVAPPSFSDWAERYVMPDKLDGSIDLLSSDRVRSHQFGATEASHYFVAESLRLQRENGRPAPAGDRGTIESESAGLYVLVTRAAVAGDSDAILGHTSAILRLYVSVYPELVEGPLGLVARDIAARGPLQPYPDILCGTVFFLGMAYLVQGAAHRALIHLTVAEKMIRDRLSRAPRQSELCRANYLNGLFCLGISAKTMGRDDIVDPVRAALTGANIGPYLRCDDLDDYEIWRRRAEAEL